ncbi:lyase [Pilimelia terevasa]|uniref:Lyase n=1 Tax=Pilimelia terevasa TaxID=53372 RepID=A0A8J3FJC8_9ACTN|nr:VOC family protein [Pilimelia terevasa]GGK38899.1 lyase [Pilimelia terevasa]
MNLTLTYCFVAVDDHEKALAFYRDAVGLEVRNDVGAENMRWVTMGLPGAPHPEIVLEPPAAHPDASPADREALGTLLAKGLLRGLVFGTDDCDGTFARVSDAGGEVLQEPMDQPYGVRDCAFRDPAGNIVRFTQKR